jgi:hypothetical protein
MLAKVPSEEIGGNQDGGQCVFPLKSAMGQVEVEMRYPVWASAGGGGDVRDRGEQLTQHSGDHRFVRPCQTY